MTTQENRPIHTPVMVQEIISFLKVRPEGIYVDGTVGLGGHAKEILSRLDTGRVLGIDRDEEALAVTQQEFQASSSSISLHHGSYTQLPTFLKSIGIEMVDGILLDLGLSSLQLDSPARGFSYKFDGNLDMRFDASTGITAQELIHDSSEKDLADLIYRWGEERHSRRIARAIKQQATMNTIADLNEAIRRSIHPQHRNRSTARVYQALRIAVNQELDELGTFLENFCESLAPGGRIAIISFHSLEDRMVKQAFKRYKAEGKLDIITKRPAIPEEEEMSLNRRSRSAKLRVAERTAV